MFIDPSMGGRIYNPWLTSSPILQRYGEMNPNSPTGQKVATGPGGAGQAYRFFGMVPTEQKGPRDQFQIFRSFF